MGIPDALAIAENVRMTRERRNISRGMMAAALGVDDETVSGWESGTERIAPQMLYRISLVLGVRVSALFSVDEPAAVPAVAEARPAVSDGLDRLLRESRTAMRIASETRCRLSVSLAKMLAGTVALNAAIAETRGCLGAFAETLEQGDGQRLGLGPASR